MDKYELHARKFFRLASSKWDDFQWETFEDFVADVGLPSAEKRKFCKKSYDKPNTKENCFWGTFYDDVKARKNRKKTYIWKE